MNIADYFKAKSDAPIDALIEELKGNDVPVTLIKCPHDKSEAEAIIDRILGNEDTINTCLPG